MKDLNGEKTIGIFYEKELLRSYYPEPESHIGDKVEVLLNVTNYANKKN